MKLKHVCEIENELGQTLSIENAAWIYGSNKEFLGDFEINFCPICGLKMDKKD